MNKGTQILYYGVALLLVILLLSGCNGGTDNTSNTDHSVVDINEVESKSTTETEESTTDNSNEASLDVDKRKEEQNAIGSEENIPLSKYSQEEIEYARIWLQLGPNQEIDELNVRHILVGSPLNPDDDTSAKYLEDVIQLAGSRLVDGSVTYSRNWDGTINVYNVPLRWDGIYPASEKFYIDIINNTKLVSVDTGNDEEIINLVKKLILSN
ncbi:hypothetical protein [Bacillus sp. SM2101]|uniref:hypothetical protein n=1 Tax=Bacillus sp. SM2101 TaxID=2805366 RepID=UPI001BDDE516|nr:hypothetical protein [Bacillus sp. SM2101]